MLFLKKLVLQNFKNYPELKLDFSADIQTIVGENGSGKTNLLDAIHYLSLSKSAFNYVDQQNIRHGEDYFTIKGNFVQNEEEQEVFCAFMRTKKKVLKCNDLAYERISDHIGKFPLVLIAPQDQDLILGGSEIRRRFFDSIISQMDAEYLQELMKYQRVLQQRNHLLKRFFERKSWDEVLLQTYDQDLLNSGEKIYHKRQVFLGRFQGYFQTFYQEISGAKELSQLNYQSGFAQSDFREEFYRRREKDRILQRTTFGIHRDDYQLEIEHYPLKKFGSQGQQKSYLLALKLAHFEIIRLAKSQKPILLLDDIFDKLDDFRMEKLLTMVSQGNFGQIFISDARPERSKNLMKNLSIPHEVIRIHQGVLQKEAF